MSEENRFTIFRFFVPIGNIETNKTVETNLLNIINRKFSKTINQRSVSQNINIHNCNEVLLAEDNPTILKKYES